MQRSRHCGEGGGIGALEQNRKCTRLALARGGDAIEGEWVGEGVGESVGVDVPEVRPVLVCINWSLRPPGNSWAIWAVHPLDPSGPSSSYEPSIWGEVRGRVASDPCQYIGWNKNCFGIVTHFYN